MNKNELRILHIIPSLIKGGAQRLAIDICNELHIRENIKIKLLTFSELNDFKYLMKDINWVVCPAKVRLSVLRRNYVDINNLFDEINSFNPNIIHSHLFEAEVVSREAAVPGVKYVTHLHSEIEQMKRFSPGVFVNKKKFTNFYERRYIVRKYLECSNNFIAISEFIDNYYKKNLPVSLHNNIKILYNAIDFKRFQNKNPERNIGDKLRLINVARMIPRKNQRLLIDVISELRERGIKSHLKLIGYGEDKQILINMVREKGLEKEISIISDQSNIDEYLADSYIYLHSARDGLWGLSTLEAMATGLPIVGLQGNIDGNINRLRNYVNGFIIEKEDPKEFIDKIEILINNVELYKSISLNNVIYAQDHDIKSYTDNLINFYKKIV